jgi:hypothetical protein
MWKLSHGSANAVQLIKNNGDEVKADPELGKEPLDEWECEESGVAGLTHRARMNPFKELIANFLPAQRATRRPIHDMCVQLS